MVKEDTESFAVFGATRVLLCALVFFNVSCRLKRESSASNEWSGTFDV
jgi:hypothetical protein